MPNEYGRGWFNYPIKIGGRSYNDPNAKYVATELIRRSFNDGDVLKIESDTVYICNDNVSNLAIEIESPVSESFRCAIDFGCGEAATALTYPDSFLWSGDHLDENRKFVPISSCRYHIDVWFDGSYIRANASGVIV